MEARLGSAREGHRRGAPVEALGPERPRAARTSGRGGVVRCRMAQAKSRPAAPVRVVLLRPRNPENLGAVARAMKNFGLADWAIAELGTHDFATARRVAVHAGGPPRPAEARPDARRGGRRLRLGRRDELAAVRGKRRLAPAEVAREALDARAGGADRHRLRRRAQRAHERRGPPLPRPLRHPDRRRAAVGEPRPGGAPLRLRAAAGRARGGRAARPRPRRRAPRTRSSRRWRTRCAPRCAPAASSRARSGTPCATSSRR